MLKPYWTEWYIADIHWTIVNLYQYLGSWYYSAGNFTGNWPNNKMIKEMLDLDLNRSMDKKLDKNKSCNKSLDSNYLEMLKGRHY